MPEVSDLTFRVVCWYCGQVIDEIPVEGDRWREAESWAYLARRKHEKECSLRERERP